MVEIWSGKEIRRKRGTMKKFTHNIFDGELTVEEEKQETNEIDELRSIWKDMRLADLPKEERDKLHLGFSWCKREDVQKIADANIDCLSLSAKFYLMQQH